MNLGGGDIDLRLKRHEAFWVFTLQTSSPTAVDEELCLMSYLEEISHHLSWGTISQSPGGGPQSFIHTLLSLPVVILLNGIINSKW